MDLKLTRYEAHLVANALRVPNELLDKLDEISLSEIASRIEEKLQKEDENYWMSL